MKFTLSVIPELQKPNVIIKNPQEVEKKIQKLIDDGLRNLQIVSDFDHTLTKQRNDDGTPPLTSFGILHQCPSFPEASKVEVKKLFEKYRPYELDESIDRSEKCKIMLRWWQEEENFLRGFRLPIEEFEETTKNSGTQFRDGTLEMLNYLNLGNVPVLIFSAGLGNSIMAVLKVNNVQFPNVKVISNFLKYNDDGTINGMAGSIIHTMNKNEQAIRGTEYYDLIKDRRNVLLMGDAIGDAGMADGISHDTVLRIGFVYEKVNQVMPSFTDAFDIVLIDDQTVNIPSKIIRLITKVN